MPNTVTVVAASGKEKTVELGEEVETLILSTEEFNGEKITLISVNSVPLSAVSKDSPIWKDSTFTVSVFNEESKLIKCRNFFFPVIDGVSVWHGYFRFFNDGHGNCVPQAIGNLLLRLIQTGLSTRDEDAIRCAAFLLRINHQRRLGGTVFPTDEALRGSALLIDVADYLKKADIRPTERSSYVIDLSNKTLDK